MEDTNMNKLLILFFMFLVYLPTKLILNETDGWNAITPLKTSKKQVENILGQGENKVCESCIYKTENEKIIVNYAKSQCNGNLRGWNVSPDTVLTINVIPNEKKMFSDLKIEKDKLLSFTSDSGINFYVNQEAGIVYRVNALNFLTQTDYLPLESDNLLRCKGFLPYNPIGSIYPVTDSFTERDLPSIQGILDVSIINLLNSSGNFKIYLVIYSGRNISSKQYKILSSKIKEFAYQKRNLSNDSFEVIDGGKSNIFQANIFVINKKLPPPVPNPINE
jgi:hypothetical protein